MTFLAVFLASLLDPVMWLIALIGSGLSKNRWHMGLVYIAMLGTREGIAAASKITYSFPDIQLAALFSYAVILLSSQALLAFRRKRKAKNDGK
ncbi:MAG: hypothetical protein AB7S81_05465 [Bdellovibrionales bacterium]